MSSSDSYIEFNEPSINNSNGLKFNFDIKNMLNNFLINIDNEFESLQKKMDDKKYKTLKMKIDLINAIDFVTYFGFNRDFLDGNDQYNKYDTIATKFGISKKPNIEIKDYNSFKEYYSIIYGTIDRYLFNNKLRSYIEKKFKDEISNMKTKQEFIKYERENLTTGKYMISLNEFKEQLITSENERLQKLKTDIENSLKKIEQDLSVFNTTYKKKFKIQTFYKNFSLKTTIERFINNLNNDVSKNLNNFIKNNVADIIKEHKKIINFKIDNIKDQENISKNKTSTNTAAIGLDTTKTTEKNTSAEGIKKNKSAEGTKATTSAVPNTSTGKAITIVDEKYSLSSSPEEKSIGTKIKENKILISIIVAVVVVSTVGVVMYFKNKKRSKK
jgi:hypothetical protein